MNSKKLSVAYVTPVLISFFVMSFCDLVGIGVDNAKADFELNNTLAQLIPLAVFAWFFILSVPVGIMQDRIGKRNMLNIGMLLTAFGLILPFFVYTFPVLLIGFGLMGIGNTIIQVSGRYLWLFPEGQDSPKNNAARGILFLKMPNGQSGPVRAR